MPTLTYAIRPGQLLRGCSQIDSRDYLELALREALMNCLVH